MIIEGEREGGITILFADKVIDNGGILVQKQFPIEIDDTIMDVMRKSDELFPGMLIEAVERIERGNPDIIPQTRTEGAYYHSRRPRDGEIHWRHQSAERVHNLVRALDGPYPSAFTTYDGQKLLIEKTSPLNETIRGTPGRVARRTPDGVAVVAADRSVLVEVVRRTDDRAIDANEFFETVGVDLGG
jgi:methionyl-tRNA formyltransferase